MHLRRRPITPDDWLARLTVAVDRRLTEAAVDVVETLHSRPWGVAAALGRFGFALGSDGWPVEHATTAIDELIPLAGRSARRQLRHWAAVAALAEGWASGYVRGAHSGMCLDPITGLATALVLRLRLTELAAHCAAVGTTVARAYSAVLVDLDGASLDPLAADRLYACAAATTQSVFHTGETIARLGGRLVVLAPRSETTATRAAVLHDRLAHDPVTAVGRPSVVVDELPADQSLGSYVADLTV